MRVLIAFVLSSILVCCLTTGASAGLFGNDFKEDEQKALRCFTQVDNDPSVHPVTGRVVRRDPSLSQLADEAIPDENESRAIQVRAEREVACRELLLAAAREHRAPLISAYQVRFFQTDLVYTQLMKRRITFGNANRLIQEAYLAFSAREDQYLQARNDAQRRAIADSLNQISQQARTPPPPYPSSGRLTCRWVGPTLYCDPY